MAVESTTAAPSGRRRTRRSVRKRTKRALVVTHRWASLILGAVLLVVTTSGAVVLYAPEYFRATHPALFHHTDSARPLSPGQALDVVRRAHPEFPATMVNFDHGVYEVGSSEGSGPLYGVDPGTGRITGRADANGGFMGFMVNLHACGLTCAGYPGYVPWFDKAMPTFGQSWMKDVKVGGFVLAFTGVVLLLLALSGVVLWWPGVRRWRQGFRVRFGRGRFARDYDLHQVVGLAVVPFLLMWSVTGVSFEFPAVSRAWYAVTGGRTVAEPVFASGASSGPDITVDAAVASALGALRPTEPAGTPDRVVYVSLPDADDPAGYYDVIVARGLDPWRYGVYPGQVSVGVDRHDPRHVAVLNPAHGPTLSNTVWDQWRAPMFHYGYSVNGWWRLVWLLFGLSPLVLAATGVSTWLYRRGTRRRRAAARAA
nr:PepSY-associated TM helix domain-containing protein [Actinomadura rayongensis]